MHETEAYLVSDLVAALPRPFLGGRPWAVATEVGVGKRIADVVIGVWQAVEGQARTLSVHESVLIASLLRAGPQTLGGLSLMGGEFCGKARVAAESLLGDGLLERRRGNKLSVSITWRQRRPARVIAIEAKLRDWREALTQAERYFAFADEAYVALAGQVARRIRKQPEIVEQFAAKGVGLVAVDAGRVFRHTVSVPKRATGWQREFVGSRLLRERRS